MNERQEEFLQCLAEVLEVPAVTASTDYRTTPLWGSLTCFALKVMLSQRFSIDLPLQAIASFATVGDLMNRVLA